MKDGGRVSGPYRSGRRRRTRRRTMARAKREYRVDASGTQSDAEKQMEKEC